MSRFSQIEPSLSFLDVFIVNGLVIEARERGSDAVLLPHLEVLPKVLVSTPRISLDQFSLLVLPDLVEVGIPHIHLLPILWPKSVAVRS